MSSNRRNVFWVGSVLLGLVACERNEASQTHTTGATTTQNPAPENTGAIPTTSNTTPPANVHPGPGADTVGRDLNDGTIDRLAEARCQRATMCKQVGNGQKWNDEAACARDVRQKIYDDYRQNQCHTVLTDNVIACVHAIHGEKCDSAFEVSKIDACRKSNLCKD